MITVSGLFDAYLDVNILLAFACVLWALVRLVLRAFGFGHAYTAQLITLRMVFLTIVLAPFAVIVFDAAGEKEALLAVNPVNLSDFIVAQYLQGNFEMRPERLESILGVRRHLAAGHIAGSAQIVQWLIVLAVVGIGLFFVRLAASIFKLRRLIDDSFVWRRFGRLELRLSDRTTVPFSTRSWRRRLIIFPSTMLAEPEDLKIALGHELQHLRQRDVDWEIAFAFLRPLFFWNPAFHIWKRQVERLRELSCDRQVVMRMGYDVSAYCECLLRVCHNSLKRRRFLASTAPVVGLVHTENRFFARRSAEDLRRRLMSLLDGKVEKKSRVFLGVLIAPLVGLTMLAALSIQRPGDWSQDRLMLSTIVNLERLATMNANSTLKHPSY
jgi:beta-lactamase regulating signal transducer with metallopeptidase domain